MLQSQLECSTAVGLAAMCPCADPRGTGCSSVRVSHQLSGASCFKEVLLKITVSLPHCPEIAGCVFLQHLHAFARSFQSKSKAALTALDLTCEVCGNLRASECRPLTVTASHSASCSTGATSAHSGTLTSPVCSPLPPGPITRMPLSLPVQLHGHIHGTNTTSLSH